MSETAKKQKKTKQNKTNVYKDEMQTSYALTYTQNNSGQWRLDSYAQRFLSSSFFPLPADEQLNLFSFYKTGEIYYRAAENTKDERKV